MKHLESYRLFESKLSDFVGYIEHDLVDDGFDINLIDPIDFVLLKYKNTYSQKSRSGKSKELKMIRNGIYQDALCLKIFKKSSTTFNTYDIEPSINRLLEYAKELEYSYEIRKITQMSRNSVDITNHFNRKLREDSNRNIFIVQILFVKK